MITGLWTTTPGAPFLETLIHYLKGLIKEDPLSLGNGTIILPTRRAVRTLDRAFQTMGREMGFLRPTVATPTDYYQTRFTPTITVLHETAARGFLAFSLQKHWKNHTRSQEELSETALSFTAAFHMGGALWDLYETCYLETGIAPDLTHLSSQGNDPAHITRHLTLCQAVYGDFETWCTRGRFMTPACFLIKAINALSGGLSPSDPSPPPWSPDSWVLAAGFDGSLKPMDAFLRHILSLPLGGVLIPGPLDHGHHGQEGVKSTETLTPLPPMDHPSYGLRRLMAALKDDHQEVRVLPSPTPVPERRYRSIVRCFSAAPYTPAHIKTPQAQPNPTDDTLALLSFQTTDEEAEGIALLTKRHLAHHPDHRIAIITPDRGLGRRIRGHLRRFHLIADDSGGESLNTRPIGTLARLALSCALSSHGAEGDLWPLLTHPFVRLGRGAAVHKKRIRFLDRTLLRGRSTPPTLAALQAGDLGDLPDHDPRRLLIGDLQRCLSPLLAMEKGQAYPIETFIMAHAKTLENLYDQGTAEQDQENNGPHPHHGRHRDIWQSADGAVLADVFNALRLFGGALPLLSPWDYAVMLGDALNNQAIHASYETSSQVMVWGPLQGRLQDADCVILGGLHSGTWPRHRGFNPLLTDDKRAALNLPPAAKNQGVEAHDFVYHLTRPHVFVTRSHLSAGAPQTPSPWFMRLDAFYPIKDAHLGDIHHQLDLARGALNAAPYKPCPRPNPTPAPSLFPNRLSVTAADLWHRHPYGFYARHILKLQPLEPRMGGLNPAAFGTGMHRALDRLVKGALWRRAVMPHTLYAFLCRHVLGTGGGDSGDDDGRYKIDPALKDHPRAQLFWAARLEGIVPDLTAYLDQILHSPTVKETEVEGTLSIPGPVFPVTLTAKADRLDHLQDPSGQWIGHVIDYKTGSAKTRSDVLKGRILQLPLEAAMAQRGGFPPGPMVIDSLTYVHLKGRGEKPFEFMTIHGQETIHDIAEAAYQNLADRIARAQGSEPVYGAIFTAPAHIRYGTYEHLERSSEWARPVLS